MLISKRAPWDPHEIINAAQFIEPCVVAVNAWIDERDRGVEYTQIPVEVLQAGPADVRTFFKMLQTPTNDGQTTSVAPRYRKKLCVVGPGSWGKTSLIKSLTTNVATLEDADTRTIGVDLFAWQFEQETAASSSMPSSTPSTRIYDVSIWDFASQDEYQSVHTLFYSKRTLYVVSVNLKAYVDALDANATNNKAVDAFVDQYIYSRMRSICVHEPESEFAFVGTKLDLINHDTKTVERIQNDLLARLDRRENNAVRQLDRAITELKKEINDSNVPSNSGGDTQTGLHGRLDELDNLRRHRPRILSRQMAVMSSADLEGVEKVRLALQDLIVESDSGFLMPPAYSAVSTFLQKRTVWIFPAGCRRTRRSTSACLSHIVRVVTTTRTW